MYTVRIDRMFRTRGISKVSRIQIITMVDF
jgi:hypothetical protein